MSQYELNMFEVLPSAEILQSKFLKIDEPRGRLLVSALRQAGFFAFSKKNPPEQSGAYFLDNNIHPFEDALRAYYEGCKTAGIQAEENSKLDLTPIDIDLNSTSTVVARFLEDKLYLLSETAGVLNPRRIQSSVVVDSPNLAERFSQPCARFFEMRLSYSFKVKSSYDKESEERKLFIEIDRFFTMKSELSLSGICEFLRSRSKGIEPLVGTFVNFKPEGTRTSTGIVKTAREDASKGPMFTVMIPSLQSTIEITSDLAKLNPTYFSSKKFIVENLCPDFEKHKRTQGSKNRQWPRDKMNQIVDSIHTELAPLFDKLELNEVKFTVTDRPHVIEEQ